MNNSTPVLKSWLAYQESVDVDGTSIEIKRRGPSDVINMDHKAINVFLWVMCVISGMSLLWEVFRFLTDVPPKFSVRVLLFKTYMFLFIVIPPLALYFWKQPIRIRLESLNLILQVYGFKKKYFLSDITAIKIEYKEMTGRHGHHRRLWEVSMMINGKNVNVVRYKKEEEEIAMQLASYLSKRLGKSLEKMDLTEARSRE